MKKILVVLVICFVSFLSFGCSRNVNESEQVTDSKMQTLAVGAITSIEATSVFKGSTVKTMRNTTENSVDPSITLLQQSQAYLSDEIKVETLESDRDGYIYKHVVTFLDENYTMYVKNKRVETESEEDELEIETNYYGIVIYEDKEYRFTCETEYEEDHEETEEQLEYRLYYNDNSVVEIKKEYETEFNEVEEVFAYEIKSNGRTIQSYKVKKEVEGMKNTLKIEQNDVEYKYQFYQENSKDYVKITNEKLNSYAIYEIITTVVDGDVIISYELIM